MAKKKGKTMKKKSAKSNPELRHLNVQLKFTERNITNDGSYVSELFKTQAEKIKKQIKELK